MNVVRVQIFSSRKQNSDDSYNDDFSEDADNTETFWKIQHSREDNIKTDLEELG